jgi:hypothetical protein
MNNPALPQGQDRKARPPLFPRLSTPRKAPRKNLPAKYPRNPLESLDSDERIQGNPRESKAHKRGLSQPNGHAPRKTKRGQPTNITALLVQLGLGRRSRSKPRPVRARGRGSWDVPKDARLSTGYATELQSALVNLRRCVLAARKLDGRDRHQHLGARLEIRRL